MTAIGSREHKALATVAGPAPKMLLKALDDDGRQRNGSDAGPRLERLQGPLPNLVPSELLDDLDVAM